MELNIAVDSGGTKFAVILYDENLTPIKKVTVGSLRDLTVESDLIEREVDILMEKLELEKGTVITKLSGTPCGSSAFQNRLNKHCEVKQTAFCGEEFLGYAAAGLFDGGLLSLSGTGSATFIKYNGQHFCFGGYGSVISDEGSGYWMGRLACEAAIRDYENRGEKTLLKDMITKHFDKKDLHAALFSIYGLKNVSHVTSVASVSKLVGMAALEGDVIARQIIKDTARSLADQAIGAINRSGFSAKIPATILGSVWRCPYMIDDFTSLMKEYSSDYKLTIPQFEPIIGALIKDHYERHNEFNDQTKAKLLEDYPEYKFTI